MIILVIYLYCRIIFYFLYYFFMIHMMHVLFTGNNCVVIKDEFLRTIKVF